MNVKDAVLTTPDPTVFPAKGNPANKYTFGGNDPNILDNPAWVATFIGVSDATPYLNATTFTSFDVGASVKAAGNKQAAGSTIAQQFTYTGLPANNSDFGTKQVTLTVAAADINTTQSANVQVFFSRGYHDHPGPDLPMTLDVGEVSTPNWYFYWSQTSANFGTHYYTGGTAVSTGVTYFSKAGDTHFTTPKNTWVSLIYLGASTQAAAGTWNNAEGIDFFANICRHEEQHRMDLLNVLWGNRDVNQNLKAGEIGDQDGDYLPTDVLSPSGDGTHVKEHDLGAMYHPELPKGGYDPKSPLTMMLRDHFNYGVNFNDGEDFCLHRQQSWTNGSADKQDWAHPEHQW